MAEDSLLLFFPLLLKHIVSQLYLTTYNQAENVRDGNTDEKGDDDNDDDDDDDDDFPLISIWSIHCLISFEYNFEFCPYRLVTCSHIDEKISRQLRAYIIISV